MDDIDPSICRFTLTPTRNKFENSVPTSRKKQKHIHSKPSKQQASKSTSQHKNALTISLSKILLLLLTQFPLHAVGYPLWNPSSRDNTPIISSSVAHKDRPTDVGLYFLDTLISIFLVLLGGVFAGLTLGLMGQDEIHLQVIQQSGEPHERKAAGKVLSLLKRGKHWVLVTLLLSNVVTNETLPIVLDRVLGGGLPAVVSSTVAIVIFGEIIPQSVSVRYGLSVGAWFAPFVLALMYITYPIAYPIALLLDWILGEDHGTIYKRAGLKSLVGLHKTMGAERLNDDEVTIISAVLDLKDKSVSSIMTPIEDVYTMCSNRILDESTIEEILHSGFNRIPIHAPDEPTNFIGMLLVRTLITYDPEDKFPISAFPLATLPETGPQTSCLNILNYFQEGKSHMVVVSTDPGASSGAIGVLTLEDVIEELIGEEIVDESDVYVDVHNAIRRTIPGPLSKGSSLALFHQSPRPSMGCDEEKIRYRLNPLNKASNPKMTTNLNITIKPANMGSSVLNNSTTVPSSPTKEYYPQSTYNSISTNVYKKGDYVIPSLSKYVSRPAENVTKDAAQRELGKSEQQSTPEKSHKPILQTAKNAIDKASDHGSFSFQDDSTLAGSPIHIQTHKNHHSGVASESDYNPSSDNDKYSHSYTRSLLGGRGGGDIAYQGCSPSTDDSLSGFYSYKAGSIIESIVNVDGVSKTIIADINKDKMFESYNPSEVLGKGYRDYSNVDENGYGSNEEPQSSTRFWRKRKSDQIDHEPLISKSNTDKNSV